MATRLDYPTSGLFPAPYLRIRLDTLEIDTYPPNTPGLHQVFKYMNLEQDRRLHFYGSFGAGKSYLVSAMVCLLKKEGRTVVYIPDYYELLLSGPPSLYVLKALSLTFNSNPYLGSEIRRLARTAVDQYFDSNRLDWQVTAFCNRVSSEENGDFGGRSSKRPGS